jgi:integrase/recombinase XerD
MSGGPYGRGKAPERACLPVAKWPDLDRALWLAACAPADLLDESIGARADHSFASNRKAAKGYGRWLTFLAFDDPGCLTEPPASRITEARVKAYIDGLNALGNGTQTVLARLQELGEVAKIMGPGQSWTFINRLASRVRARHKPVRTKSNLKLSDELLSLGIQLIDQALSASGLRAAVLHRDGLLIALLSLVPLRRRNIASLELGRNLLQQNSGWLIALDGTETKTHAPLEMAWPNELIDPLEDYLETHRPLLAEQRGRWSKPVDKALWVSTDGSPMTEMAIYDRIRLRTKDAFGVAVNPHLFRDAAATTLAIADPQHVRVAAPLLGHRTFTTTERHYLQARGLEAHREFIAVLSKIREGGGST